MCYENDIFSILRSINHIVNCLVLDLARETLNHFSYFSINAREVLANLQYSTLSNMLYMHTSTVIQSHALKQNIDQ